jgi:predicted dehydrogenase
MKFVMHEPCPLAPLHRWDCVVDLHFYCQDYVCGLYPAIQVTEDVGHVLEDHEIQAVVIATPVRSHFELAMKALAAGKHFLVEKPIAITVDDVVFMKILDPNKVMANIHVSWLDPRRLRQMTAVGSKKMVVYDNDAESKIIIYDKGVDRKVVLGQNMDYDTFHAREGDVILPRRGFAEPVRVEVEHFADGVEHGTACLSGIDLARAVVRILSA